MGCATFNALLTMCPGRVHFSCHSSMGPASVAPQENACRHRALHPFRDCNGAQAHAAVSFSHWQHPGGCLHVSGHR